MRLGGLFLLSIVATFVMTLGKVLGLSTVPWFWVLFPVMLTGGALVLGVFLGIVLALLNR